MTLGGDTIELTQRLIRAACVNDYAGGGSEEGAADILEEFFADSGLTLRRITPRPGRTTLVATVQGSDSDVTPLTLLGHTDVVPVDEAAWSHDPFAADIEDGYLWGRGSVDMLHLTAAMAAVTREIAREAKAGRPPRATLVFVGAADEEARGGWGVPWIGDNLSDALPWEASLSEMGGSHIRGKRGGDSVVVIVGEKGAAQRRLHVSADSGHGSIPLGRVGAVEALGRISAALASARWPATADPVWAGFVRAFEFDEDVERSLIDGSYEGDYSEFGDLAAYAHAVSHMSVAQTVIRAGDAINVLPSQGYIELDIRTLPGQSDDDVDAALREALGEWAPRVRIERLLSEEATASGTDTPLYRAIEAALSVEHPGARVVPVLFPGGSDLRVGRRQGGVGYGIGSFSSGASLGEVYAQLHAHDERIRLQDVESTVRVLRNVVRSFLNEEKAQ